MPTAQNFFSPTEQQLIIDAITIAELKTSGEIRMHIENFCFGDELKTAMKIFRKLNMHLTTERNGVLIYIAVVSKKIAIVGDVGIHEKLGNTFWHALVTKIVTQFKANKKAEVLAECILECGEQLSVFFPGGTKKANELNNSISF